jgi:hypothetical protein
MTLSSTPVRSRQLLGGTLADDILRVDLRAEYEDIDVTTLVFTDTGAGLTGNVDRLELYKTGDVTPFAVATLAGCGTNTVPPNSFCSQMQAQQLIVPKGGTTTVIVRPRMRSDMDGAVSGRGIRLSMDPVYGVGSRGAFSSNTLPISDGDALAEGEIFIGRQVAGGPNTPVIGRFNVVVLSKVTSITNADPNANGTAIPSGTARAIGQFKFTAAAANNMQNGPNKVAVNGLIFNVNATNVDLDGGRFKFYNKADPMMLANCTVTQSSGSSSLIVTCADLIASGTNTSIDPGSDATFVLQADVQNAKVNNGAASTLQVSLQNFSDLFFGFALSQSASHIEWKDADAGSSVIFRWIEYPDTSVNGTSYQG